MERSDSLGWTDGTGHDDWTVDRDIRRTGQDMTTGRGRGWGRRPPLAAGSEATPLAAKGTSQGPLNLSKGKAQELKEQPEQPERLEQSGEPNQFQHHEEAE